MATPRLTDDDLRRALELVEQHGSVTAAADALGIPRGTMSHRYHAALTWQKAHAPPEFEISELPSELPHPDELIKRRIETYERRNKALMARTLIPVTVKVDGPIGIAHFGDPHLDDDGSNMALLREHVGAIKRTTGLMAGNVGDTTNNWVGRLARLHAEQETTAAEAWVLAEWLFAEIPWLYVIGGNHDVWSGDRDILKWIAAHHGTLYEWHGARLELQLPNGRTCRINARHDFTGHSQWNVVHGASKAAQMGWRDHVLTCGHKHTAGYQVLKDPSNGLISHAIRVGTYKMWDSYARAKGLPNQNAFPACVTIIDPNEPEDSTRFVTVILDVLEGAEYLTWKRKKARV